MVHQGDAPLVVAFPHTGTTIPLEIEQTLRSPWLALKDTDWWVDTLYALRVILAPRRSAPACLAPSSM